MGCEYGIRDWQPSILEKDVAFPHWGDIDDERATFARAVRGVTPPAISKKRADQN